LRIGFVGLGMMGRPMAANLEKAGFAVQSYDLSGTGNCRSCEDAARGAEILVTMVPTGKDVRNAVFAALPALPAGATVVDMSSSEPVGTRRLGAELAACGIALVDAPVSGGVKKAVEGTLSIMAGGEPAHIERVRPVLEKMGARIFLTGPLGSGHAMKALNNYVSAAGLAATAEALLIGEKFGLDPATVTDILNASTGRNNTTEVKVKQFMLSGAFNSGFSAALMAKDVATAAGLADAIGARADFAHVTSRLWKKAAAGLGAGGDHTAMYRYLRGLERAVKRPSAAAGRKRVPSRAAASRPARQRRKPRRST
jgi:3-hydroxyisobutyrate dehydrogenase